MSQKDIAELLEAHSFPDKHYEVGASMWHEVTMISPETVDYNPYTYYEVMSTLAKTALDAVAVDPSVRHFTFALLPIEFEVDDET